MGGPPGTVMGRTGAMVRVLLGWLMCLVALGAAPPAMALTIDSNAREIPLGAHYQIFEDAPETLIIDDVAFGSAAGRFHPLNGGERPNLGYSESAFWLRVELDNRLPGPSHWLLELPFPTLDEVQLYLVDRDAGEVLARYTVGDRLPFAERPYPHRNFVFPLTFPARHHLSLYLRVASQGSLTVASTLWPPDRFVLKSREAYMASALYFGILGALLGYNLLLYFSLRERVYLYYVLFVGSMALAQGAWHGLFFEYLWPGSPRWANVAVVVGFDLTGLFAVIFSRAFLHSARYAPLLDRVMIACLVVFAAVLLTFPLLSYQFHAMVTSFTGMSFSVVAVIGGLRVLLQGVRSARFFLFAWTILLVGTAALGARNLGLVPTNVFTLHAMQIGSALEMLLLSFALAERIAELRRQKAISTP